MTELDTNIQTRVDQWLTNPSYSEESKQEIQSLLEHKNYTELRDRFFQNMEFGTGGIRGKVGAGLNRMNIYNIRLATQGVCNYASKYNFSNPSNTIAICYDSRNTSLEFAMETAQVMLGNGYKVLMFTYPSATPLLSFVIRKMNCMFGVNITASHNPPEYNGYKVFWDDGAQVVSPVDQGVIDEVSSLSGQEEVKSDDFQSALSQGQAQYVTDEVLEEYYKELSKSLIGSLSTNSKINAVYSAFHGVGYKFISRFAELRNLKGYRYTQNQQAPDGNFPTLLSPNPENPSAFKESIAIADEQTDIILATDPDADRTGCMCRDRNGQFVFLTGNQIGILLLESILEHHKKEKTLSPDAYVVTTIVSTPALEKVAARYKVETKYCYTGFKNIAKVMSDQEKSGNNNFLFGCEESHGYLISDILRDKDGISAAIALSEYAASLKENGLNLLDKLDSILASVGYYEDGIMNYVFDGEAGKNKILCLMETLRTSPPDSLCDLELVSKYDYKSLEIEDLREGTKSKIEGFVPDNTLVMQYDNDLRIMARPSGTEPKIKFYINLSTPDKQSSVKRMENIKQKLDNWISSNT